MAEADAAIRRAAARKTAVTVDLRGLTFMDSTGINLLVRYDALARQGGFNMFVVKGNDSIQRLLEMCGLAERFKMIDAPEDLTA